MKLWSQSHLGFSPTSFYPPIPIYWYVDFVILKVFPCASVHSEDEQMIVKLEDDQKVMFYPVDTMILNKRRSQNVN